MKCETFWQKWQGVSLSFLSKIHNFANGPFLYTFSSLDGVYDLCLFKICNCRSFHEMFRMTLFDRNGKGLAYHFCPKFIILQMAHFHIFSSLGVVYDLCLFKICNCRSFHEMFRMTLFDRNGKGLAYHFCPKFIILQMAHFHIFSSLEGVYDLCLFKICNCRSFHEMLKMTTFWQKWQGVSLSFLSKIHNFANGPFLYIFSSLDGVYDLCLFKICNCRSFQEMWKMKLFDRNGKGLAYLFCPKFIILQMAHFHIFSSLEVVYDLCLFKICNCRSFHEMWKMTLFDRNGKGLAYHFCPKFIILQMAHFHIFSSLEGVYDLCLFKICNCRSFQEMWKMKLFDRNGKGLAYLFCPKFKILQMAHFYIPFHL